MNDAFTGINDALAGINTAVAGVNAALADVYSAIAGVDAVIAGVDAVIAEADDAVAGVDVVVAEIDAAVAGLNAAVAGVEAAIAGVDAVVAYIDAAVAYVEAGGGQTAFHRLTRGDIACDRAAKSAPENMKTPENFEAKEGYSCYRLSGHGPLAVAARKVVAAITFSREQQMSKLLIDTTKWTGHGSPDTMERFTWAQAFAEAARSAVKLAMVIRPELMDPEKFEVTVATNRGLAGCVFDSEKEALAWLLDPNTR